MAAARTNYQPELRRFLPASATQIEEIKASIKFQLKKVLCLGVAIGHVGMAEKVRVACGQC